MPEFNIDWEMPCVATVDERNRQIWKLRLNDQWTIVIVFFQTGYQSDIWAITSLEIHRKNTAGNFSISGKVRIRRSLLNVSHIILTGSSTAEITSNINQRIRYSPLNGNGYYSKPRLCGVVNISDISEKLSIGLVNKKSKEAVQLKSLGELSNDFERLLETSRFADVTLKCGSASIPAHKLILSTRSPVFAAMFANPMKESLTNEVEIPDIDVSVLRALLVYMYTGKTRDMDSPWAADLLFAVDKYQLPDLRAVCTDFLMETVSFQNVWRMLVLGDLVAEDLKSFAMDYICNACGSISVVKSTEEWKTLRKERPRLAFEVMESFDEICESQRGKNEIEREKEIERRENEIVRRKNEIERMKSKEEIGYIEHYPSYALSY